MAQAELSSELIASQGYSSTGIVGFWNTIKRWPLVSIVVLTLLILTALFADVLAPYSPIESIPDNTTLAPFWYDPVLVSVSNLPRVVAIDGESTDLAVVEAAAQYGVELPLEALTEPTEIRKAFNEQAGVRVTAQTVDLITQVKHVDSPDVPESWVPVGGDDDGDGIGSGLSIIEAAKAYNVQISLEQLADPLYGSTVAETAFKAQANLSIETEDGSIPRPVLRDVGSAAAQFGVVIPEAQQTDEAAVERAFLEQANLQAKVRVPGDYLLGGDNIGRDLLSRMIHGARVSLVVVAIALTSGLLIGVSMGLVAGWFGGLIDEVIMRITDIWLGLPFILVAIVVVIAIGQTFLILIGLLALLSWTPFVRNVRGEVLSLKTRDYVSLAQVAGASTFRIMIWHLLPGVINTVIVIATLRVGQLILTEAILSFLGAGIPPPTPAWGAMVNDGRAYISDAWWISFFPGFCIFLVVMSLNFLGDWMRDKFDPRLRNL